MKDMTKGSIIPQIINFSLFIFIGGMMQNLYLLIDSIILGQFVGEDALAAIGIATAINFVVIGLLLGITQGFSINMANSFGAGNLSKFRKLMYNSIMLCIFIGVIFSLLLTTTNKYILILMNTPEHLLTMTNNFLIVIYLGCIFNLFYNLFAGVLRSIGNSSAPLIFLSIAVVSNIVLVYLFVAIIGWGLVGSAFATIISQCISATTCYFFIKKKYPELRIQKEDKKINSDYMKILLRQGVPMGLQFSFTGIGVLVLQTFLNGFTTNQIAGFSVAIRVQNILAYLFVALGSGIATFIGQNYGAKKFDRIKKAVNSTAIITIVLSIIMAIFMYFLGEEIATLFTKENNPELISAVQTYFNSVVWAYPMLGLLILYRNALQGYGYPISAMFAGIVELIMRVLVVAIFTSSYGYLAICYADSSTWVVTGILLIIGYYYLTRKKDTPLSKL